MNVSPTKSHLCLTLIAPSTFSREKYTVLIGSRTQLNTNNFWTRIHTCCTKMMTKHAEKSSLINKKTSTPRQRLSKFLRSLLQMKRSHERLVSGSKLNVLILFPTGQLKVCVHSGKTTRLKVLKSIFWKPLRTKSGFHISINFSLR